MIKLPTKLKRNIKITIDDYIYLIGYNIKGGIQSFLKKTEDPNFKLQIDNISLVIYEFKKTQEGNEYITSITKEYNHSMWSQIVTASSEYVLYKTIKDYFGVNIKEETLEGKQRTKNYSQSRLTDVLSKL